MDRCIHLRGVEVHNLKRIDLDVPHRRLIVLCGVSGSGKSSLALDTLYAEGQRRYIETFSAYTRQFLERVEKPAAERIDGIPPAIAVAHKSHSRSSRSTVGTATDINDYLRLLYSKIGRVYCSECGSAVSRDTPQSAAEAVSGLEGGRRFLVTFAVNRPAGGNGELAASLREDGFVRAIVGGIWWNVEQHAEPPAGDGDESDTKIYVVVDRLATGSVNQQRLRDSLETAFQKGCGRCYTFVENSSSEPTPPAAKAAQLSEVKAHHRSDYLLDGAVWQRTGWSSTLCCEQCDREYPRPEPRLYSFNSPLGACTHCEGFGNVIDVDMDLVVPNREKSLRKGAIAPWNTPSYAHELAELLELADDHPIRVDVPFRELTEAELRLLDEGVPERDFGGLRGYFAWLERRKYKMHIRVFLSRWQSYRTCPECDGARLRPEALATRIGGLHIADVCRLKIQDAVGFFDALELTDWEQAVGRMMLDQVRARLGYLQQVGLGYMTLERPLRTLSGGEARRVALTSALGSSLVNMLYVLDEPSIGLHARDVDRLLAVLRNLTDRGNTVVVVEHEEAMIRAADQAIEIGPAAGERGGEIVFQGTPQEMESTVGSLTGDYLARRRMIRTPQKRRTPNHGWIRLAGARGNNLQNLKVDFPLGLLCVVTGVSGSGKSTLVQDTLYPALCRRLRKEGPKPYEYDDVFGDGQIDDCILVDQNPIGRSPRSNPVTYIKAFDEIRAVLADTIDARTRGYTASHFSFNAKLGRCNTCQGDGYLEIDMQFLADVSMRCSDCHGTRYRGEILDVAYRGRNIADILEMTVREAFTFFRGHRKVQSRLKRLIDVGLDYIRLGQPAKTLSGGEAQRLKLAGYLSSVRRGRCLFLLDEPTTGLHPSDIVQLLDCFEALLSVGHSLIVVEHNLQLIKSADYVIDLGPDAAEGGGRIVATGTPEMVSQNRDSITARFLGPILAEDFKAQSA